MSPERGAGGARLTAFCAALLLVLICAAPAAAKKIKPPPLPKDATWITTYTVNLTWDGVTPVVFRPDCAEESTGDPGQCARIREVPGSARLHDDLSLNEVSYVSIEPLQWLNDNQDLEVRVTDTEAVGGSGTETQTATGTSLGNYNCVVSSAQPTPFRTDKIEILPTGGGITSEEEKVPIQWNYNVFRQGVKALLSDEQSSDNPLAESLSFLCSGPAGAYPAQVGHDPRDVAIAGRQGQAIGFSVECEIELGERIPHCDSGGGALSTWLDEYGLPKLTDAQREATKGEAEVPLEKFAHNQAWESPILGGSAEEQSESRSIDYPFKDESEWAEEPFGLPNGTASWKGTIHAKVVARVVGGTIDKQTGTLQFCDPLDLPPCESKIANLFRFDIRSLFGLGPVNLQVLLPPLTGSSTTGWAATTSVSGQVVPAGKSRSARQAGGTSKPVSTVLFTGAATLSNEVASPLTLTPTAAGEAFLSEPHPATLLTATTTVAPPGGESVSKRITFTVPATEATVANAVRTEEGTPQSVTEGHAFLPLSVEVTDAHGAPVAGAAVTFAAPPSGASGTFESGDSTITVTTDSSGIASVQLRANDIPGEYSVQASVNGVSSPADFALTNTAAGGTCEFLASGSELTLESNCATSHTIDIPEGTSLNGAGHTITAVDPGAGRFEGAVLANAGKEAGVSDLTIVGDFTDGACPAGRAEDQAGIAITDASVSITGVAIDEMNKGEDNECADGDGILVDDSGGGPFTATIEHDTVDDYQDIGIEVSGADVTPQINANGVHALYDSHAAGGVVGIRVRDTTGGLLEDNNVNGGLPKDAPRDSTGILAEGTLDLAVEANSARAVNFGIALESLCPLSAANVVAHNELYEANIGVYLVAQYVAGETTCTPEVNDSEVIDNTIHGPGTFGVWLVGFANEGSYAPVVNANLVQGNTISGYLLAVDDEGTNTGIAENGE